MLKLTAGEERRCYEGESSPLAEKIAWFRVQSEAERLVLALEGLADPSYSQLKSAAAAIADAWEASMPPDAPVLVLVERDMAKALGFALRGADGPARAGRGRHPGGPGRLRGFRPSP